MIARRRNVSASYLSEEWALVAGAVAALAIILYGSALIITTITR